MAQGAAKDTDFKIDSTGVLTDITAYMTSITFSESGNVIDVTTMGDTFRDYVRGVSDATISIGGVYEDFIGTLLTNQATATATHSWEFFPQGSAAGKIKYSGESLLTTFDIPSSLDEAVTWSASYQNTGAITYATI